MTYLWVGGVVNNSVNDFTLRIGVVQCGGSCNLIKSIIPEVRVPFVGAMVQVQPPVCFNIGNLYPCGLCILLLRRGRSYSMINGLSNRIL